MVQYPTLVPLSRPTTRIFINNYKTRTQQIAVEEGCNCRRGLVSCPVNGDCLKSGVIYRANVETTGESKFYVGAASTTFKERFRNHQSSFKLPHREFSTTLSSYVW